MARGRDEDSSEQIGRAYDRYASGLYRYAVMILADPDGAADVIQQVFVALLNRRITDIADLERYLRRAVRNECLSMLRGRRRESTRQSDRFILELTDAGADPADHMVIEEALRALPPEQREVIHLKLFEGMTFQEIAVITEESINTIASRYRYAIDKLRPLLGERG